MTNLAAAIKDEMRRIARKEMRAHLDALKKSHATYRSEIAAVKKRAEALEREVRRLSKTVPKKVAPPTDDSGVANRFSAKGFASHRERLGISAAQAGLLLGASGQSVYNWEAGTSKPRASHMPALAAFRKLGKRAAMLRLEELNG